MGGRVGKLEPAGPEVALVCACYGYTPSQVASMTPAQFRYLAEHMPDVELRRTYPTAALEAVLLNIMGGKPDPREKREETDPARVYTPFERLPWYARPTWTDSMAASMGREAARDFLRNRGKLPAWAVTVAPIDQITSAANS